MALLHRDATGKGVKTHPVRRGGLFSLDRDHFAQNAAIGKKNKSLFLSLPRFPADDLRESNVRRQVDLVTSLSLIAILCPIQDKAPGSALVNRLPAQTASRCGKIQGCLPDLSLAKPALDRRQHNQASDSEKKQDQDHFHQ